METFILITAGLMLLVLCRWLLFFALKGAVEIGTYAGDQGFIGVVVYILCWFSYFPVMFVISTILGCIEWLRNREYKAC